MTGHHLDAPPTRYQQVPDHGAELEPPGSDSDKAAAEPAAYKRYPTISRTGWGLEILSLLVSLGLFTAIVAIFCAMHNKPLNHWGLRVSLNSLIAFLATACSTAMMHNVSSCIGQLKWLHFRAGPRKLSHLEQFDEASRGPYGSATFLVQVKWNLASIGALITICRLAFGPFAQQVIDPQTREITIDDSEATFGFTHQYRRNFSVAAVTNTADAQIPQDPLMQSAILQGIYNLSIPPEFSCTGSCSWSKSYISLGFKSVCENVTVATLSTQKCDDKSEIPITCNMTTPQGIIMSTRRVLTDSQTTFRLNATSDGSKVPALVRFAVYRATPNESFEPFNENVTECVLSLAAYNYSRARSNGSSFNFESVSRIDLPTSTLNISDSDRRMLKYELKKEGLPQLELGLLDTLVLQSYFKSGTISAEWVDGSGGANINYGISAALMGDVDLPARFDRMAASMTDYLRSGPNSQLARGGRIESVVFVSVRWVWLIGPAAMQLAALIFTVSTMVRSRTSCDAPLWKSSALAVLSCIHDKESESMRSVSKDIKEIQETASRCTVRLE